MYVYRYREIFEQDFRVSTLIPNHVKTIAAAQRKDSQATVDQLCAA